MPGRLSLGPLHPAAIATVESFLRHPFSLQKITWNATTQTVIYRSKRHYNSKRNFEIFKAPDFIAAALLHLPPKGQQTVRYYGTYSNKTRGQTPLIPDRIIRPPASSNQQSKINNLSVVASAKSDHQSTILLIPAPPKQSARDMRPLWRDLILLTWGGDPLQCPCCKGTMRRAAAGSRETDCTEGAALKRSGRVKEPEEATESNPSAKSSAARKSNSSSASTASGRESSHSPFSPATPFFPASGPTQWLFQGPPAESKLLAAALPTELMPLFRDDSEFSLHTPKIKMQFPPTGNF